MGRNVYQLLETYAKRHCIEAVAGDRPDAPTRHSGEFLSCSDALCVEARAALGFE